MYSTKSTYDKKQSSYLFIYLPTYLSIYLPIYLFYFFADKAILGGWFFGLIDQALLLDNGMHVLAHLPALDVIKYLTKQNELNT